MTNSPDFFAQTAEDWSNQQVIDWRAAQIKDMRGKGATGFQFSYDDTVAPNIFLLEGWIKRPRNYPQPHFHLAPAMETPHDK